MPAEPTAADPTAADPTAADGPSSRPDHRPAPAAPVVVPPGLFRFGAVSGVLAGVLIGLPGVVEGFTGETTATSVLIGLSPALAFPALVALYLRHARPGDRLALPAFAVNLLGLGLFGAAAFTLNLALFFLPQPALDALLDGPTRTALLGSAVVFAVGSVLFGAVLVRSGTAPPVASWAYTLALPAFALLAPLPDSPLTSALHGVVGLALVRLSARLA